MAKRQRTRPGQRPPAARATRPAARPATARPVGGPAVSLTAAEEARAAEIEAQLVADERAAEATRIRGRDRRRDEAGGRATMVRTRDGSLLAARAEEEYAYVARDVRRIVRVGGSLLGVMFVLFILIDVAGVVRL